MPSNERAATCATFTEPGDQRQPGQMQALRVPSGRHFTPKPRGEPIFDAEITERGRPSPFDAAVALRSGQAEDDGIHALFSL